LFLFIVIDLPRFAAVDPVVTILKDQIYKMLHIVRS